MRPRRHAMDLSRAVRSIWSARLRLAVRPAGPSEVGRDPGRSLIVVVRPEHESRAGLVLECPATLARRVAAALRGVEEHVLGIEEVEEAMGDLAALTGRHLWPGTRSGRPMAGIVDDRDDRPRVADRPPLRRAAFACEGQVFRVTVIG